MERNETLSIRTLLPSLANLELSLFLPLLLCSAIYYSMLPNFYFIIHDSNMSVVHPVKVNRDGQFSSHSLVHRFTRGRQKRDVGLLEGRVYYKVSYKGRDLFFNLTVNNYLVSNNYILERRNGTLNRTERSTTVENDCHLIGTVTDSANARGTAAISTCEGLKGLFNLPEGPHFIEPVQGSIDGPVERGGAEPHIIYPSVTTATPRHRRSTEARFTHHTCGVKGESNRTVPVSVALCVCSNVSLCMWVETMVVADSKLLEYHGSDNVEAYIFTIMNMVAGIFHDASIGNAIHMVLVRLILLQGEEKGLKIVHHADSSLTSFCAWQKNLNPQSDTHPAHHDVAVLVTRKDICAGRNQPCETLGLSHLSGMCQPHRSCNINEDSGLPVAFTIAHELGHSFGIQHDGQGNDCELEGRHPFIMSRQLMYDTSPLTWSTCSKDYITRFLDRGWGFCLDDRPSKKDMTTPLARLGVRYTAHHQCQLQYGPNATYCHEIDNVCQILWCSVNGSCRSKLDSPIDGTRCGPEKWCISGECVIVGKLPETVNGNWGQWSSWSHCSRTCGAGVQSADRECNHPKPEFGGKYCTGERRRYRICNTSPCQKAKPTFREMLCSEFDTVPYQNELYQWVPVATSPCELHCRPVDEHFSEKMLDAVTDGTPCFMNNNSKSICVNGVCKVVGCDYGIESNAVEDRCGVCLGDGSSCETVHMTFDGGDGFGYVDVGVIPKGARDIVVQEMEEAGNFLALRGQGSEEYFLNGQYIIQWNGEYKAAGTIFYYERSGNLENLTSPGPTKEPVMIQLLYQEKNPGIKYEYTIKKSHQAGNKVLKSEYRWKYGAWTDCSTSCGLASPCFLCALFNSLLKPIIVQSSCQTVLFLCRWWVGGWQPCTASCGPAGLRKRTVLCVRTVAGEERVLHPGDCKQLLKPKPVVPCNRDLPCGPEWAVGNWSACPVTCGGSVRTRTSLCALQSCPSLRRRPGPPLRYRRIYPPNRQPTGQPVTHTWGPKSTRPTTAPRTSTVSVTERTTTPINVSVKFYTLALVKIHGNVQYCTSYCGLKNLKVLSASQISLYLLFKCSTSCGLGAVWRPVMCSSQQDSDCANLKRPEPARTCHLRPCVTWLSGNWSKCPQGCEVVGRRQREVQCVDSQNGRPLRPFHCQALSSRPPSTLSCRSQPCQPWRTSPWGQCSRSCGGGLTERLVYCPELQHCSPTQRPNDREALCNSCCVVCVCQCSVSCGGGVQRRVVRCVLEESGSVDDSLCKQSSKPDTLRKCNMQECQTKTGPLCKKNSMSSRFCDKLKLLGRCTLKSIQKHTYTFQVDVTFKCTHTKQGATGT
uniref:Peptidase M12B domain-containing protein n=1 Tax=Esox lucius TaxID=8010 RepID=A0A6Q2YH29_ESOLU